LVNAGSRIDDLHVDIRLPKGERRAEPDRAGPNN
jgi:hypothetical protein